MRIVIVRPPSGRRVLATTVGLLFAGALFAVAFSAWSPLPLPWFGKLTFLASYFQGLWKGDVHPAGGGKLNPADLTYIEGATQLDLPRTPWLSATSAILVDNETGTILYAKNENARRAPASTTKILTALLAIEHGRLDRVVTVSRRAANVVGSDIRLHAGQEVKLHDLVAGLLIRSGNDAAVAIAEAVAGSVENFACLMNRRAAELGATNSHFVNPHGLDHPGHYSTAHDLAVIARTAMHYELFSRLVATKEYAPPSIPGALWHNTNRLLWSFDGMEGIKTGTTGKAGNCLVAAARRDGRQLISVVMDSGNRWGDTTRLLEYGFSEFTLLRPASRGKPVAEATVVGARREPVTTVPVAPTRDLVLTVRTSQAGRYQVRLEVKPLPAPVRRGAPAGNLLLLRDGKEVISVPLVTTTGVGPDSFWRRLWRWFSGR